MSNTSNDDDIQHMNADMVKATAEATVVTATCLAMSLFHNTATKQLHTVHTALAVYCAAIWNFDIRHFQAVSSKHRTSAVLEGDRTVCTASLPEIDRHQTWLALIWSFACRKASMERMLKHKLGSNSGSGRTFCMCPRSAASQTIQTKPGMHKPHEHAANISWLSMLFARIHICMQDMRCYISQFWRARWHNTRKSKSKSKMRFERPFPTVRFSSPAGHAGSGNRTTDGAISSWRCTD